MEDLFKSIHLKYRNDTTGLKTTLSGGLFLNRASTRAKYPYGVYTLISNVPDEGFDFIIDEASIQFDIFSDNRAATSACRIYADLISLYDWCTLSTTGSTQYSHISMNREMAHLMSEGQGDNLKWRYLVEYGVKWQSSGNKP